MARWLFIITGALVAAAFLSGIAGIWTRDTRWVDTVGVCLEVGALPFVLAVFAWIWES